MARVPSCPPSSDRRAPPCAGFGLLEVLVGTSLLAIGLLAYVASVLSTYRLQQEQCQQSEMQHVTQEITERLQNDEDWAGLYARLRDLQADAKAQTPGAVTLRDGRWAHPVNRYYSDIPSPPGVDSPTLLVEVPSAASASDATEHVLREDAQQPRFGLPADLNGDGLVDAHARDADYDALPIIITFSWEVRGGDRRELTRSLWLRGNR